MKPKVSLLSFLLLLWTGSAMAASFVVPTDDQLVAKSAAIAVGTVEGSFVQETGGTIETIYEIRAERGFKGAIRKGELIRVVTLGGVIGDRGVLVPGEAHFAQGERVLLFLDVDKRGRFRPTDLTLGRFEFVTSTTGEKMLVREMEDVVGWDQSGKVHKEKVRKEEGFLRFVEERTKGRTAAEDYVVEASQVTIAPQTNEERFSASANATLYPASTYTDHVNNQPIRWPNISAGVLFHKRSDTNIAGAGDGGVSVIQGGLAAWTNEPASNINLIYNGQIAKASANHDATNVVEFNDPQGRISGSWGGSGTVGVCFLSFSGSHTFLGASWLNITDADVVFQDGYPATNASFSSAMTHELGHGIGWRHSNQNPDGAACNSAVEECTSAAIMNSSVSANYGFTLQPWDVNAAQSVYPGASTCVSPLISAQPTSRTITAGSSTTLSVTATGTALSYQWYVGTSGNTASPIAGATGSSVTVAPGATTNYWVRVFNSCGSVNSATATVTVTAACTAPSITAQPTSRSITAGSSTTLSVGATGTGPLSYQWYIGASGNTASPVSGGTGSSITVSPASTTSYWVRVSNACGTVNSSTATVTVTAAPVAGAAITRDFNGDGRADILWRNPTTGQNVIWPMGGTNGNTRVGPDTFLPSATPPWQIFGAADFNKDGKTDIVWRNTSTGAVQIWLMNGTALAQGVDLAPVTDLNWRIAGTGDFNSDGFADLIWRNFATGANEIWLMNGTSIASKATLPTVPLSWTLVGAGQFNRAGATDILWRNTTGAGEIEVWLMNGTTVAGGVVLPSVPNQTWQIVAIADYNADGSADVVFRNNTTLQNVMWLMNNTTRIAEVTLSPGTSTAWTIVGPR